MYGNDKLAMSMYRECKTCHGTGKVASHNPRCWDCCGTGYYNFDRDEFAKRKEEAKHES